MADERPAGVRAERGHGRRGHGMRDRWADGLHEGGRPWARGVAWHGDAECGLIYEGERG